MKKPVVPPSPSIRIKAGQAALAVQALQKLFNADFPAMEAFQLAMMTEILSTNSNVVATDKTRMAMIKKHGVEKDGNLAVPPENMGAFLEEYMPVAERFIELPIIPLPCSILEHAPKMTPAEMMALKVFFTNEGRS
jgi:hypothetical protein